MTKLAALYEKLLSLTELQREKITSENYGELMEVLEKKNNVIEKIDRVSLKDYLGKQNDPERKLEYIKKIMKKTKKIEDKNVELIEKNYNKLGKKLKDINTKEKTRKGYQGSNKYEAKFIDKKS